MSLLNAFAVFVSEAILRDEHRQWGNLTVFAVSFFVLFIIVSLYFFLASPFACFFAGLAIATALGVSIGLLNVLLIRYVIHLKRKSSGLF